MTLLSDIEIMETSGLLINPFVSRKQYVGCLSYGLGSCGYDIRLGDSISTWYADLLCDPMNDIIPESARGIKINDVGYMMRKGEFVLAYSLEAFALPSTIEGSVKDKSTLARLGIAVQNTVLEPGWWGQITLELTNHGPHTVVLRAGMPIAQVQFRRISTPSIPYDGRYQNQEGVTLAKRVPVNGG